MLCYMTFAHICSYDVYHLIMYKVQEFKTLTKLETWLCSFYNIAMFGCVMISVCSDDLNLMTLS